MLELRFSIARASTRAEMLTRWRVSILPNNYLSRCLPRFRGVCDQSSRRLDYAVPPLATLPKGQSIFLYYQAAEHRRDSARPIP